LRLYKSLSNCYQNTPLGLEHLTDIWNSTSYRRALPEAHLAKEAKMKNVKFCECNQYCLNSKCISSDSGLKVAKCWCADCKEMRKEVKANAYKITVVKVGA
jgi:hypothetical protein